jgi:futalosine hydrolase
MSGKYSRAVQAGIAGSFVSDNPIGSVAVVSEEGFADLGAESHGSFLDLFDMGLVQEDAPPFSGRFLVAPALELPSLVGLPRVRSITVNRVLSEAHSIAWARDRYTPKLVNMEGAAFFYVALLHTLPFLELRSISDMVGPRDKSLWRIAEAVEALDAVLDGVVGEW